MASSVKELHGSLRMAFRLDAEADPFIKRELEQMFSDFGPDRTARGVLDYIRSAKFFNLSELREAAGKIPQGDKDRLFDANCADCDEGWREVWFDELTPAEKNKLLETYSSLEVARTHTKRKRCHCWRGQR